MEGDLAQIMRKQYKEKRQKRIREELTPQHPEEEINWEYSNDIFKLKDNFRRYDQLKVFALRLRYGGNKSLHNGFDKLKVNANQRARQETIYHTVK